MSSPSALRTYLWFCRWVFPRSYSIKFLAVAFLGIHVPLIGYVVYLATRHGLQESLPDLIVVLAATLLGTVLTLVVQYQLLAPVRLTDEAVQAYRTRRVLQDLPSDAPDQAGHLMRNTRECLVSLDQLMRLKDSLAAGIAHDFRNPIGGIIMMSDLQLADETLSARQRVSVQAIKRTAEAQLRQINGLLDAVLDDTRNANFETRKVRVADLWNEVQSSLGPIAASRGLQLSFAPTDAVIAADQARITQVLNNLTSNALKATPSGGRIELSAEPSSDGWRLRVRDNGHGFDASALLQQLNSAAPVAAKENKLGLGLRLSQALLQLHAAKLAVASKPGHGTEFSFSLKAA